MPTSAPINCEFLTGDAQLLVRDLQYTRIFAPEKYALRLGPGCKVYSDAHVPPVEAKRKPRSVIVDAHRATMAWARAVMRKHGKLLQFVAGNGEALAVQDSLYDHLRKAVQPVPRCVQAPTAQFAKMAKMSDAWDCVRQSKLPFRIVAPNLSAQKQVMAFLRGGARRIRHGDPVWLWRQRKRDHAYFGGSGYIDLAATPRRTPVRLQHAHYVPAQDINVALVDTPATVGAEKLPLAILLVGLPRATQKAVLQSTTKLVMGVGFMPDNEDE